MCVTAIDIPKLTPIPLYELERFVNDLLEGEDLENADDEFQVS